MTSALSIRIPPEIEHRLALEVARLNTTKSRYVQDLLVQSLAPKDPVALLRQIRSDCGIPEPTSRPRTDKSRHVKALVKEAVARKHNQMPLQEDGMA